MAFWKKSILNKKRKQALTLFRKYAIKALHDLERKTKNPIVKNLYKQMAQSIQKIPIIFYPSKVLSQDGYSITRGEHVHNIQVIQKGKERFMIKDEYINLPSEHLFSGDKLTMSGIFTLCHEYAHFTKSIVRPFAYANHLTSTQAEELMADMLAAKLAYTMGFSKNKIMRHFHGRQIVYGSFPFKSFIEKVFIN